MKWLLSVLLASTALSVFAQPPKVNIDDWTPRPATGPAEPWEKKRDPEWDDARFLSMDTGPAFNATYKYALSGNVTQMVYKGTSVKVRVPGKPDVTTIFDRNLVQFTGVWTGPIQHSPKRFALLNTPKPTGQMLFASNIGAGAMMPTGEKKYLGMYDSEAGIQFRYREAATDMLASFQIDAGFTQPDIQLTKFTDAPKPHAKRWGEAIVTKLLRGNENSAFAIDTLTIPTENRFKALFYCTGVDFLPDGRVAVCTAHGDVWLVTVDDKQGTCTWQRFATGLYQPLGLKVVAGRVHILERGQLTRLTDINNDGEADYYESLCGDWSNGGGEHAYDTCLETDPEGNFYFHKTGDTHTPHGCCVLKIAKDGSKSEIFATGTRHPIGMGMSPTGILTGADQEGNWMPATRIDEYKKGGFYGDMRGHHRAIAPTTYDPPLCWLPREVDNSAGGQTWIPEKTFGPLAGLPLHFSYGRCKAFLLIREERGSVTQGGVWDLNLNFLSGVCRGRFNDAGHLYIAGLNGWQTAAQADGCLQRVRATGKPVVAMTKFETRANSISLTFSQELDAKSVGNLANFKADQWNYRWTKDYGSKRYRVSNPNLEGQDTVTIRSAKLLPDGKTVQLNIPGLQPVMQMQIGVNLKTTNGEAIKGLTTLTLHDVK
jgi:hypothetical protein